MKIRRGFTLIEALVSMAVIAILAALGYMGVDEYVTSAKATKIIMNLHTVKKALWEWYVDNSEKVAKYTGTINGKEVLAGMVNMGGGYRPIQEIQINNDGIHLSNYLKRLGTSGIRFNPTVTDSNDIYNGRKNTNITKGYYGICDGGTIKSTDKKTDLERHREDWYVGYCFNDNESAVRAKIKGRMKSGGGLRFGTADAHWVSEDKAEAVWLQVR
ncbi:MAG: prepilin-type N-terminal cleavage/methylation domain-containing protein [Synergistaceae bacterium]|nr:prepilin-type N-terminal cleavage/methylation domain-containing protein [Synergistaceae bacterium]MBQ6982443.1 prepilin-type N-terminal cleavage/methylation domain-containing protein [Synergistaceae bacterium]